MNKDLLKTFEKLSYAQQPAAVFSDLLTVVIAQFCPPPHYQSEHAEAVKRLGKKDLINQFVYALVQEYQSGIIDKGWCDPWGDLYMELSSNYKSQSMGQYFTPVDICSMMAKMSIGEEEQISDKRINDPACGSGRTLLAAKAFHPNNYFFGEDLDPICCKMAVVNFAFHGCIGEVVEHNTLAGPKELFQGWKIANIGLPLPAVLPLKKEESYICSGVNWFDPVAEMTKRFKEAVNQVENLCKESEEPVRDVKAPVFDKVIEKVEQLSLFG